MTEEELLQVDPNTADEQILQQLPGIGPALAKRILAARPFMDVEDMLRTPGLGRMNLERIKPFLIFPPVQFEDHPPQTEEAIEVAEGKESEEIMQNVISEESQEDGAITEKSTRPDQSETKLLVPEKKVREQKPREETLPEKHPRPREKSINRTEMLWLMVGVGILTMIFSILINLAILAGINGTLDFNRLSAVQQLDKDLELLTANLKTLDSDLGMLEQRVKPLEGLSGRMTTVEEQVGTLQGDMEQALSTVEGMQTELQRLSDETTRLTGRVGIFDSFLEGLNRLLGELFASTSPDTQE